MHLRCLHFLFVLFCLFFHYISSSSSTRNSIRLSQSTHIWNICLLLIPGVLLRATHRNEFEKCLWGINLCICVQFRLHSELNSDFTRPCADVGRLQFESLLDYMLLWGGKTVRRWSYINIYIVDDSMWKRHWSIATEKYDWNHFTFISL